MRRMLGVHGYAVSALLMAMASVSPMDEPPRPAKPKRSAKLRGPVIDTTKETKREKRRRLRGV